MCSDRLTVFKRHKCILSQVKREDGSGGGAGAWQWAFHQPAGAGQWAGHPVQPAQAEGGEGGTGILQVF